MRLKDVFSSPGRRTKQLFAELGKRAPKGEPDEGRMLRLIAEGVDLGARSEGGLTPLLYAACMGREAIVRELLKAGANIFDRNNDREAQTPLIMAAYGGHTGVCRALIEAGAPVDTADMAGSTALHEAMTHPATVSYLIGAGADIHATDRDGWTPLHRAVWNENSRSVSLLLLAGANPYAKDKDGRTPLDVALKKTPLENRVAIVRHLKIAVQGGSPKAYRERLETLRQQHREKFAPRATVLQKSIAVKGPITFKK